MPKIEGNPRDRILDDSLVLFSEKGYAATTMRDIAEAAGMKAASLYNHFKGKQELFDALIERESSYVESTVRDAGAMASPEDDPHAYLCAKSQELSSLVWDSYAPFFDNARIKLFMRMLASNRYGEDRFRALCAAMFIERPIELQKTIFSHLVDAGVFAPCDIELAAMEFHGPMLMLMEQEASADHARAFCLRHVEQFNDAHRKDA